MSSYPAKAIRILREAETKLRQVAAEALAGGDYAALDELVRLTKAIADLASERELVSRKTGGTVGTTTARPSTGEGNQSQTRSTSAPSTQGSSYPRFERRGKRLVKLGWSSRDGRIYEHRAPYEAVEAVYTTLVERSGKRAFLPSDKILPVHDDRGEEIPSYQVYLVLKWLQELGVVQKQGKDGYAVINGDLKLRGLWERTPERQS